MLICDFIALIIVTIIITIIIIIDIIDIILIASYFYFESASATAAIIRIAGPRDCFYYHRPCTHTLSCLHSHHQKESTRTTSQHHSPHPPTRSSCSVYLLSYYTLTLFCPLRGEGRRAPAPDPMASQLLLFALFRATPPSSLDWCWCCSSPLLD